jgi:drug/metabolite transporter (DMT)-like permease
MKIRIVIALLAVYLIWGSTYLAIRFAVETIPPFLMAGTRFLVAGLLLVIWRYLAGDPRPTRKQWLSASIVGLLLLLGGNGLVSWAEQGRINSGTAALLVGTVPIWMVLIEAIFYTKQRPRWQAFVGLLTGFIGIVVLIGPQNIFDSQNHANLLGTGAVIIGAFLWSIGSVYSHKAEMPGSPLMGTGMQMLVGSVGLFLVSLLSGEWKTFSLAAVSLHSGLGLLYLIVFGSLGGFVAYGWLLRNAPIPLAATYAYVNPLVAILLGNWLAQEHISAQVLVAAAIIIGSVVLINTPKKPDKQAI